MDELPKKVADATTEKLVVEPPKPAALPRTRIGRWLRRTPGYHKAFVVTMWTAAVGGVGAMLLIYESSLFDPPLCPCPTLCYKGKPGPRCPATTTPCSHVPEKDKNRKLMYRKLYDWPIEANAITPEPR